MSGFSTSSNELWTKVSSKSNTKVFLWSFWLSTGDSIDFLLRRLRLKERAWEYFNAAGFWAISFTCVINEESLDFNLKAKVNNIVRIGGFFNLIDNFILTGIE